MNDQYVRNVIEAALLAGGRPLASDELVALFDERDGSNAEEVQAAIAALRTDYETRGLELVEVASGYRIQIRSSVAQPVARLWQERPTKYSRAFLETLALVAYRQPITRGEIEQIRGVAVNPNIIKTLLERGWVRVLGHRDVPGKPELLGTTRDFLDYFGLVKLDDLPTLAQLKELEELRVQLSLPGADPVADPVATQEGAAQEGAASTVTSGESDPASHAAVAVADEKPDVDAADSRDPGSGTAAVSIGLHSSAEVGDSSEARGAADAHDSSEARGAADAHDSSEGRDSVDARGSSEGRGLADGHESTDAHGLVDGRGHESEADDDADTDMDESSDSGDDDDELDASGAQQRPHGLVARGSADDPS
jgi:segregation and condensation protein B